MLKKTKTKIKFKRASVIFLTVLIIVTFFPSSSFASSITETGIFNLTNNERTKRGVFNLSWNYKLAQAARVKAQDMIDKDYFSHNSPDGRAPWNFIEAAGYNYIYAGENLAMSFNVAEDVVAAWMDSGGHRDNILSVSYRELGVGVVTGEYQGYTTTMVVQMFGAQVSSAYEGNNPSVKSTNGANDSSSSFVAEEAFDHLEACVLGREIIGKRLDDFRKAHQYLIRIVEEKKEGTN